MIVVAGATLTSLLFVLRAWECGWHTLWRHVCLSETLLIFWYFTYVGLYQMVLWHNTKKKLWKRFSQLQLTPPTSIFYLTSLISRYLCSLGLGLCLVTNLGPQHLVWSEVWGLLPPKMVMSATCYHSYLGFGIWVLGFVISGRSQYRKCTKT